MSTATAFPDRTLALRTLLRGLGDLRPRSFLFLTDCLLSLTTELRLIVFASHVLMHGRSAHAAVAVFAHLAAEDVTIGLGGHQASPVTISIGTCPELLIALAARSGGLVEPSVTGQYSNRRRAG